MAVLAAGGGGHGTEGERGRGVVDNLSVLCTAELTSCVGATTDRPT